MRLRTAAWFGLLLAALLLVGAGFADRQLKTATHPGFLPEGMPLYAYTPDLPLSWLRLSNTALSKNLSDEARPVLHDMELSVRRLTGIRPTPARWRVWLGGSAAAATDGRNWILCAHPGLAARAASWVFAGGAFPGAQLHQAWRGGYLLLSSSSALIEKALAAPPVTLDLPESLPPDALVMELRTPLRARLTLTPGGQLPIEARIMRGAGFAPRSSGPWKAPVLSGNPAAILSLPDAQSAEQLATLLKDISLPDFSDGLFGGLVTRWSLNRLPQFLSATGPLDAPMAFAFYDLSTDSGAPLPRLAAACAAREGFSKFLLAPQNANKLLPYEWNGCAGWMFPLFGDQFSLYGFQRDDTYYLATREPLAAALASASQTSRPDIEDDAVITLDWKRTAPTIMEGANWAAAHELLPETNQKDLDAAFIPVMRALSKCGTLRVAGRWTAEGLLLNGVLADGSQQPEHKQ